MIGAHQPIPDIEIQAEVGSEFLVVQGMVRDGVEHRPGGALQEPARHDFKAAVPQHIEGDLPGHERRERGGMDRDRKDN